MKRPNRAKLQAQCDAWNAANPVGVPVALEKDNGETQLTVTRSAAQVLSGHSAVIWLDGVSGCYLLDRVTPLERFLILQRERVGDLALWWRPDRRGYTTNVDEAGRYTEEEALSIQAIRGGDIPVPESFLRKCVKRRTVVSSEDGDNFTLLKQYRSKMSHE
jgi:hypothetical protein